MEIKVGKYTFVITENVDSWNGIITNINYKIGGNIRDCVNISVQFDNNSAISASMPHILYDEECSLNEPLGRGEGSVVMITTILRHIKTLHPQLKKIKFDDMSSIECATEEELERNSSKPRKKGTNLVPMPLYYLSIAYNGQTWYEKYFNAVQEETVKQNAYRSRVNKMLHDPSEKPDYIQFLKITKAPMNIRAELEPYFTSSATYSDFFHSIPRKDRCRLLRPWIKEFMSFYLKGVFSNLDWEIQLSNIRGGKTRKTKNMKRNCLMSKKRYYCPRGFVRNADNLADIGGTFQ
jgi:hypothetical protein